MPVKSWLSAWSDVEAVPVWVEPIWAALSSHSSKVGARLPAASWWVTATVTWLIVSPAPIR